MEHQVEQERLQKKQEDYEAKMNKITNIAADEKREAQSMAAQALERANGIIQWPGPKQCDFGYKNIWQYIAGHYHPESDGARPMRRMELACEYSEKYKYGFDVLAQTLMDIHNLVLIKTPIKPRSRTLVCITIEGSIPVNAAGETAAQIYSEREFNRVMGQLDCSYPRLVVLAGEKRVRGAIWESVLERLDQPRLPGV